MEISDRKPRDSSRYEWRAIVLCRKGGPTVGMCNLKASGLPVEELAGWLPKHGLECWPRPSCISAVLVLPRPSKASAPEPGKHDVRHTCTVATGRLRSGSPPQTSSHLLAVCWWRRHHHQDAQEKRRAPGMKEKKRLERKWLRQVDVLCCTPQVSTFAGHAMPLDSSKPWLARICMLPRPIHPWPASGASSTPTWSPCRLLSSSSQTPKPPTKPAH